VSREAQLEAIQDIREDGRKVTLRPPRGAADFVSGSKGAAAGADIQTHMLQEDYEGAHVNDRTIFAADVKFIVAAGSIPKTAGIPGPGWEAFLNEDGEDETFPDPSGGGVSRHRVIRLERTVSEGAFALLYYLQVRS
jgi:hypothetical protein